ncbi:MAG: ABC transporter permease [Eubacteriales bacterium]|nr:ABC transporter permease [Eubacteriales bacterium]
MEKKGQNPIKKFLGQRGVGQVVTVFFGLIALCIVFYIMNPNFLGPRNIPNLLRQIAPFIIIGIGQGYVLITANIDLSIGSVVGMTCMIIATMICKGSHPIPAILVAFVAALATGVINGSLVAKFKLPPFVATLGTQTICRGVAQLVNNNMNTDGIEGGAFAAAAKAMRNICYHGSINIAGFKIYYPIIIALVLWCIFNFVLSYTRTGRHLYAVGSNMEASKLSGVNVSLTILKAYLVSAFNAGVVGLIVCAQTGTGTTNAGLSYETFAVAASVIGGISTMGGTGILSGVLVGASVWAVMDNGLQLIGTQVGLKNVIVGLIVIVCVLLDVIRRTGSFKKKPA